MTHATTHREGRRAEGFGGRNHAVDFFTEVTEYYRGCGGTHGGREFFHDRRPFRGRGVPVGTTVGTTEFGPHGVNVNLGMDEELLDAEVEFEFNGAGKVGINGIFELVTEGLEDFVFFALGGDTEVVVNEFGGRRESGDGVTEFGHGATEHNCFSGSIIVFLINLEPLTEVIPIAATILNGRGGENPTCLGFRGHHIRRRPPGQLTVFLTGSVTGFDVAIADNVTFIQNNAFEVGGGGGFIRPNRVSRRG